MAEPSIKTIDRYSLVAARRYSPSPGPSFDTCPCSGPPRAPVPPYFFSEDHPSGRQRSFAQISQWNLSLRVSSGDVESEELALTVINNNRY